MDARSGRGVGEFPPVFCCYVPLHSLRLTWKLPEGLCKWNQVLQKGPGSFHVSLGEGKTDFLEGSQTSSVQLLFVWGRVCFKLSYLNMGPCFPWPRVVCGTYQVPVFDHCLAQLQRGKGKKSASWGMCTEK